MPMTPAFKEYRVKELKRNPKNPGGKRFDEGEMRLLGKSLRARQWMPLIVQEPALIVLDGNRRLAAAELEGVEALFGMPVTHELSPKEINRLIAQLDIRHQPFSEIARGRLWLAIREENGWTNAQLADDLGVSAGLLTKVFGNLDNPEEIQQLVDDGRLGVNDGYHLSRIEDVAERLRIARELAEGRLTSDGVAELVRKPKASSNGRKPAAQARRIKCPLKASGATVTISGQGLSLADAQRAVRELLAEIKAAINAGYDAKTFQLALANKCEKAKAEAQP
jgi:ParB-like chromosome segregation protein Spo0J